MAFDPDDNSFGCQTCIFEKDGFEDAEFIALKARDIHDQFKENYENFYQVQLMLGQIQPQVAT